MNEKTFLVVVAMFLIAALEIAALITIHLDGAILSSVISTIVFLATSTYYKHKYGKKDEEEE